MATILVSGDRAWHDRTWVESLLYGLRIKEGTRGIYLVEGCAKGLDTIAHTWGKKQKSHQRRPFHHYHFPAEWDKHGRAAGPIRNQAMIDKVLILPHPRIVLSFHDELEEVSRGTKDLVKRANKADLTVRHHQHIWTPT